MTDLTQRTESQLLQNLLLHGLRVSDERLNAVAAELLTRRGALPARQLVIEAVINTNPPAYRVRVMAVLARIAAESGLDVLDVLDLSPLLHSRNKKVREAAHRFFGKTGSRATGAGPRYPST